jgi:hypothetical protein
VGLLQPGRGRGVVADGGPEQAQAARGHAFPAGVAQLAGQRVGVLEALAGGVQAAGAQLELAREGLRPGQEGHPPLLVDQLQGAVEGQRGLAALVPQQVGAGQDRQRPGLLAASPPRSARSTDSRRWRKAAG